METQKFEAILQHARDQNLEAIDEPTGKSILASKGVCVPNGVVVGKDELLADAMGKLNKPVVLKLISRDVIHKTEMDAVRLNLTSADELKMAASVIRNRVEQDGAAVDGWLVEEMAEPGVEVMVGGLQDPEFGPMIMIGLGGIFVEVFRDVSFRICPVTREDAFEMIEELTCTPLLKGFRGTEPVSIEAFVEAILAVGGADGVLMQGKDHIAELDINPLILTKSSATAVDARFILRQ